MLMLAFSQGFTLMKSETGWKSEKCELDCPKCPDVCLCTFSPLYTDAAKTSPLAVAGRAAPPSPCAGLNPPPERMLDAVGNSVGPRLSEKDDWLPLKGRRFYKYRV